MRDAGLDDRVQVVSCGTGDWHVGQPMDHRSAAMLTAHDYDATRHRAQQFTHAWLDRARRPARDGRAEPVRPGGRSERVRLFRDFDPVDTGGVVPDPYYGGHSGFEEVLAMVERTSDALLARFTTRCSETR